MSKNLNWGIHWFRRDLRIPGNQALRENWKRTEGKTLGIFCFDSAFLARPDFSHNRFAFFLKTLKALREDWQEQGGDLLVIDSDPKTAFSQILDYCKSKNHSLPTLISWNRDYEPFAQARDLAVEEFLNKKNIPIFHSRDHLLFEPHEILKSDRPGDFYQVYSPYAKKWFQHLASAEGQKRISSQTGNAYFERQNRNSTLFQINWETLQKKGDFPFEDALEKFIKENSTHVTVPIPEAGFFPAFEALKKFKSKLSDYKNNRDIPSLAGTSKLSLFLKNGSLTVAQILKELKLGDTSFSDKNENSAQFVKELAWREFYYSILYHCPRVEEKNFLSQYENLKWENDKKLFKRWCEGTTGFPIVDAGMRELVNTGFMHNRVRMIVASFLTKDLLIDWRWGERFFMKNLLDGDLAANNGGWQWAASTGCDPQPYFRVFNPWLQSKRFDPEGIYIKKFVPELRNTPAALLHDPDSNRSLWNYPSPVVDHSIQRDKAIALYKSR